MSYLEEFQQLIEEEKMAPFLRLWEEYCMTDQVDGKELKQILLLIKNSIVAQVFGQFAETVLPLWNQIENQEESDDVLRLILDLQTTNSPILADLSTNFLTKCYAGHQHFSEKMRIVGLRSRHSFQGAITNYELLTHMDKGKFVFHTGGWGVGEVMEISLLREHAIFEFEGISALKDLSFANIFKNLVSLPTEHFLSRRFGDPDTLEEEGKQDPLGLIHLLLKDLGPKTAQEIKEELCELVIPEDEWTKWWQQARAKIKKDTKIQSPRTSKEPFILCEEAVPHDVRFREALKKAESKGLEEKVQTIYNFTRDFPEVLKNFDLKQHLKSELLEGLEGEEALPELSLARKIQISFLLEDIFPDEFPQATANLIASIESFEPILNLVEIGAFKKRILTVVRSTKEEWATIFLHLLFGVPQNALRDYIFRELQNEKTTQPLLQSKVHDLLHKVTLFPEAFFWYFQKIVANEEVPLNEQEYRYLFLEASLVLLHFIEHKPEYRDLAKKLHQLLTSKRYAAVRAMIEGGSADYLREFLLLSSKCHTFTKHDLKIFQNLAEVVEPSLAKKKRVKKEEETVIWTTPEGYQKLQERIHQVGTVETVDNAKEIEAARALGDLRENAEYKFALERRSRLQAELKHLSEQLNKARILTKHDIPKGEVGVGVVVDLVDSSGRSISYTLLGPWDADPDHNILSFQSKLAETMKGHKEGENFEFQGENYTVKAIKSYLG